MSIFLSKYVRRAVAYLDPRFYGTYDQQEDAENRKEVTPDEDYNLVGSKLVSEGSPIAFSISNEDTEWAFHSPVLDIDFEARLVPSSTAGHYHLYLDGVSLVWKDYKKLLECLRDVGIAQRAYVDLSIHRGQTFALREGLTKAEIKEQAKELYQAAADDVEDLEEP